MSRFVAHSLETNILVLCVYGCELGNFYWVISGNLL